MVNNGRTCNYNYIFKPRCRKKAVFTAFADNKGPDQQASLRSLIASGHFLSTCATLTADLDLLSSHIPQRHLYSHYENTPIQIYRKFHLQKLKIFR